MRGGKEECGCRADSSIPRICHCAVRRYLPGDEQIADLTTTPWKPRGGSPSEMHLVRVDTLRAGRPYRSFSLVWKQTTAREALATATVAAHVPELLPPVASCHVSRRGPEAEALRSWVLTEFCEGRAGREALSSAGGDREMVERLARTLARLHQIDALCLGNVSDLIPRFDDADFVRDIRLFVKRLIACREVKAAVETHCPLLLSDAWAGEMESLAQCPHAFTHSDLSWGNLLATDRGLLAVDWGLARWFPAGIDLAIWLEPLPSEIAAAAVRVYLDASGERVEAGELQVEIAQCRLYHALCRLEGLADNSDPASLVRLLRNVESAYQGARQARE